MLIKSPMRISWLAGLLLTTQLLAGVCYAADQTTQVRVTTNLGAFVIEVLDERAPITSANFLIQGGGHDATTQQLKPTHENIANESGNGLQNKRGTAGMARGGSPHSS